MTTNPKICIVTSTRAEYGLLKSLINRISISDCLELQLIVTGTHLSPEYGYTLNEIQDDGYIIDKKIDMVLSSDSPAGVTKSMGLSMIGFADAFADLDPDLIFILGDRYEMLAAASAALIFRIPIAHCHGGEITQGAIDDAFRHSITKMSDYHFVAAEDYRRRVIQLGENPDNVYVVGGLGTDAIRSYKHLSKEELEESLQFKFGSKNLLITFHPETFNEDTSFTQMQQLLLSLEHLVDTHLIFTLSNADVNGRALSKMIVDFCNKKSNAKCFKSLGQSRYLSCIHYVDGVVGNSSSGLLEVLVSIRELLT